MIRSTLEHIAGNYMQAKQEPYSGHWLGHYIRHDAPAEIRASLQDPSLTFGSGAGTSGRWPNVTWLGVYDIAVTDSAQHGYYLVYLFAADMSRVCLSMNQGTTEVIQEFGQTKAALEELRRRATLIRHRLKGEIGGYDLSAIDLAADGFFPKGYEAGHAFGRTYDLANLPDEETLVSDLRELVRLYRVLIIRGGVASFAEDEPPAKKGKKATLTEKKQYRVHRSLDRNPKASREAKKIHGHVCQACGFDFERVYGELANNYIEAHHLIPVSSIPEGEEVPMDPEKDFAVLCANCHRMVHKTNPPKSIEELGAIPGVQWFKTRLEH